ncbi:MAG: hypothetical protein HQL63_10780 [Magnetococcales bacterium]|nr:hypothetical protein [Magnetococcales bacterium]MBF0322532.1 hypothetical protein [Magnetococcales bacterium]
MNAPPESASLGKENCPHCQQVLKRWLAPPINFSDGLGYGADALLVCFNDTCPVYVDGWNTMFDRYGRIGSMRFWSNPQDGDKGVLPVAHKDALRGDIVEE